MAASSSETGAGAVEFEPCLHLVAENSNTYTVHVTVSVYIFLTRTDCKDDSDDNATRSSSDTKAVSTL